PAVESRLEASGIAALVRAPDAGVPPAKASPRIEVLRRYRASAGGSFSGRNRTVTSHSPPIGRPYVARNTPGRPGCTLPRLSMYGMAPIAGMLTTTSAAPRIGFPEESRATTVSVLSPTCAGSGALATPTCQD